MSVSNLELHFLELSKLVQSLNTYLQDANEQEHLKVESIETIFQSCSTLICNGHFSLDPVVQLFASHKARTQPIVRVEFERRDVQLEDLLREHAIQCESFNQKFDEQMEIITNLKKENNLLKKSLDENEETIAQLHHKSQISHDQITSLQRNFIQTTAEMKLESVNNQQKILETQQDALKNDSILKDELSLLRQQYNQATQTISELIEAQDTALAQQQRLKSENEELKLSLDSLRKRKRIFKEIDSSKSQLSSDQFEPSEQQTIEKNQLTSQSLLKTTPTQYINLQSELNESNGVDVLARINSGDFKQNPLNLQKKSNTRSVNEIVQTSLAATGYQENSQQIDSLFSSFSNSNEIQESSEQVPQCIQSPIKIKVNYFQAPKSEEDNNPSKKVNENKVQESKSIELASVHPASNIPSSYETETVPCELCHRCYTDPYKIFFLLTCQTAKINSKFKDEILEIDTRSLYDTARLSIPINKWYSWVNQKLEEMKNQF